VLKNEGANKNIGGNRRRRRRNRNADADALDFLPRRWPNKRVEASMSQSRKWRFVTARGGVRARANARQLLGVCRVRRLWNMQDGMKHLMQSTIPFIWNKSFYI
jgi:hypothetical protein